MKIANNPILKGFYPDPSICRVGKDYYLVCSTFAYVPGVPVFHSTDLVSWEQIGNVLERRSQLVLNNAGMSRGIYAPSIRYHNGIYYVITTNVSYGGNFYVTASNPEGPWSDPVYLKVPDGVDGGIDPSLYFEGDRCFYVGQRQKKEARFYGDCEVWMQELDLNKGELIGRDYSLYAGAMKEACWVEGPHIYKIGAYYYITCAEMGTGFEHSICVARSKELTGPYENYKCNPLLTHRHLGRDYPIQNIGHGDLVDTPEGDWYLVMLGTRTMNGVTELGRETFLAKVTWEEDWPVVNSGEGKVLWQQSVSWEETERKDALYEPPTVQTCTYKDAVPAFETKMEMKFTRPLDKRFLFFRHPDDDTIELINDKECALKCAKSKIEDTGDVISYLGLRQQERNFSIRVQVHTEFDAGAQAGLLYLYNEKNYIKFTMSKCEDGIQVLLQKSEMGEQQVLLEKTIISPLNWMEMEVQGENQKATFLLEGETIFSELPVDFLSSECAGGFVGCTYGIYAEGAGTGYAHFKDLSLEYK